MFDLCVYNRQGISFDEVWEKKDIKSHLTIDNRWAVTEYLEWYEMDFDNIMTRFWNQNKRYPSYEEFKDSFKRRLMSYKDRFVISVHHYNLFGIQTIGKEVMKLMRRKRNDPEFLLEKNKFERLLAFPTQKARYEEIKRYLQIYGLHEEGNKSYREIAEVVYPKRQFNEDLRVVLVKEKKKAARIIKNVEQGIFPGKY